MGWQMNWLRLYTEVLDHPKLQRLPGDLFKFWVNLLCLARLHNGVLPSIEDIAFRLRCSDQQATDWMMQLIERKLLDKTSEGVRAHDWDQYQYDSDSSTQRSRKHRQKLLQQGETVDATLQQRPRVEEKRLEESIKPSCASDDAPEQKPSAEVSALDHALKIRQTTWLDAQHDQWHAAFWNRTAKKPSRRAYEKRIKALVADYAKADKEAKRADLYVKAAAFLTSERDSYRRRFENTDAWDSSVKIYPATWLNDERWTDGPPAVVPIRPQPRPLSRAWNPSQDEEAS